MEHETSNAAAQRQDLAGVVPVIFRVMARMQQCTCQSQMDAISRGPIRSWQCGGADANRLPEGWWHKEAQPEQGWGGAPSTAARTPLANRVTGRQACVALRVETVSVETSMSVHQWRPHTDLRVSGLAWIAYAALMVRASCAPWLSNNQTKVESIMANTRGER